MDWTVTAVQHLFGDLQKKKSALKLHSEGILRVTRDCPQKSLAYLQDTFSRHPDITFVCFVILYCMSVGSYMTENCSAEMSKICFEKLFGVQFVNINNEKKALL